MPELIQYTDREQTPAQRQELLDKARAWVVAQGATPGPEAEAVYARYVAGELTLQGVTDELVKHYARQPAPPWLPVVSGRCSPSGWNWREPHTLLKISFHSGVG